MLERDAEVKRLAQAVSAAVNGQGRFVLVRAEAGLGKTRLLGAAVALAGRSDMEVLTARGSSLEQQFPFGVAVALFETLLRAADPAARDDILSGSAVLVAPMLLGDQPAEHALAGLQESSLVHALQWVTINLSARRPLLLAVDDLHWADAPSLRFLAYVVARIRDLPVLVVCATRPREAGAEQGMLDYLGAADGVEVLEPPSLTADATAALVGQAIAAPADAFVEACFEMTGGNPLLVTELLRALAAEGVSGAAEDADRVRAIGPEPIARGVRATLARLGADCTALAHAVSVLGVGAAPHVAADLAGGLSPQRTAAALAGLQNAGLLTSRDRLAFTHPLLGRAVYEGLAQARRGELHRQSAELLHPLGVASATAAHLLLAPGRGEAWAVDALRQAAQEAEDRAAPAVSLLLLRRALSEPPDPSVRAGIEAEAALSAARAGEPEAPAAIEAALDDDQDAVTRPRLFLALAKTLYQHGRMDAAVAACVRGMAEADDGDPLALELEAAWAAAALWSSAGGSEQVAARLAAIIESDAPARGVGERDLLAGRAGVALVEGTDRAEVLRLARRAWGGGAYLDDGTAGAPTLGALVAALLRSGAALESLEVCDELIADARRRASPLDYATWRTSRGRTLWYLGRLDEAESDLEEALDARAIDWELAVPLAVEAMVSVLVEQDRCAAARAVLEDLGDAEATAGSGPLWAVVRSARGRLAMAENDPETALREFLAAGRQATDALGTSNPAVSPWRSEAALALYRLDRSDEAREHAAGETRDARRFGAPRALSQALRVEAIVRGGTDGLALAREAASAATAEHPLEIAHAHVTEGTLLRSAGDRPAAQELLRLGMDEAAACGARALVRTARDELKVTGARPRRERSTGVDALTASERRIVTLAADGRTSREIADALFITPRTVGFHLSNAYSKLGISGRVELIDALAATDDRPASG